MILQIKDRHYPEFPGALSFFGGALEPGEDPETGLARELKEELANVDTRTLLVKAKRVKTGLIQTTFGAFEFTLFHCQLDPVQFNEILTATVLEGSGIGIVSRARIPSVRFAWGLEQAAAWL